MSCTNCTRPSWRRERALVRYCSQCELRHGAAPNSFDPLPNSVHEPSFELRFHSTGGTRERRALASRQSAYPDAAEHRPRRSGRKFSKMIVSAEPRLSVRWRASQEMGLVFGNFSEKFGKFWIGLIAAALPEAEYFKRGPAIGKDPDGISRGRASPHPVGFGVLQHPAQGDRLWMHLQWIRIRQPTVMTSRCLCRGSSFSGRQKRSR